MAHEILQLKSVHPTTGYSHEAKVGNLLYISGQVAQDIDNKLVGPGDISAQARQAFQNLKNILEEAGGGLGHIFKMTTLLTHPGYLEQYRTVRNEFFGEPFPANTLHVVQALAQPQWLIEVEAFADLG